MPSYVKLIKVSETYNDVARHSLQINATHIAKDYWLLGGDEEYLDGVDFEVVGKAIFEDYSDLSGSELKQKVQEHYYEVSGEF